MARKQFGAAAAGGSDLTTRNDVLAMSLGDGCCRLSVASTTTLTLKPFNGNTLWVGGQACTIPSGGITTPSQTGLAASTLYYVYATASGSTVNGLMFSTTGHITGADGREYLSNGAQTPAAVTTSRLIGMVYTSTASSPFADSLTNRWCLNWFNRRSLACSISANNATSSTSLAAYGNSAYFLCWPDEAIVLSTSGNAVPNSAGAVYSAAAWVDGAAAGTSGSGGAYAANAFVPVVAGGAANLSEGNHQLQNAGQINTGSCTFTTTTTAIIRG